MIDELINKMLKGSINMQKNIVDSKKYVKRKGENKNV